MLKRVLTVFLVCALVVGLLPAVPMAAVAAAGDVEISEANFPDANFRKYVKETFDTDANGGKAGDGWLTAAEIGKITWIDVAGYYYTPENEKIKSLKGIERFTALKELSCWDNQLTSLDVSKNTALTDLICSINQLTSLDVSKNTALKKLSCGSNQLTSLDVSKNTALTELSCGYNPLTSLDVSKNTALERLVCFGNQLTSLDVGKNTALTKLYCGDNQLTSLDVSKNTALEWLFCYDNPLTSIDVSKNTALTDLDCSSNQLTSLDLSKNKLLTCLDFSYNPQLKFDISKYTTLTSLGCAGNRLTSLDVSKHTKLVELWCSDNKLTSLDVSKNTALTSLGCDENQLTSLDVSKNTALTHLYCGGNPLTSIDVSKNTALGIVEIGDDKIDNVDLSQNILLSELGIYGDLDLVQQNDGTWKTNLSEIEKHVTLPKDWFDHTKITSENIGNSKWNFETIANAKYDPNTGVVTIPSINELKASVYGKDADAYRMIIKVSDEKSIYLYFNLKPNSSLQYDISVTGGKADMNKAAVGTKVTLTANSAPAGKVFDKWTVDEGSPEVTFADEYSEKTTFTMPQGAVKVTATYKTSTGAGTGTTGKILSYGDAAGTVTIELLQNGVKKYTRTGTASYDLSGIPAGTYTMTVSKPNHATREYTIKLGSEALPNVTINMLGDVDMNGKLNMLDIQKIFAFIKNSSSITDEYQKKLADVDENKEYNMLDIQRLFNAIKKA